ncbi:MAG: response regulator transcription factor [Chloroflexota bacterium]
MAMKVLVVDDEANLVHLVKGYLEREGFAVSTAADGATALRLAREQHPDLVVLDLMLPAIDGLEVCRQLRQWSDAYVIMLSARVEEVDKIVGLSVGADDYLTKPFSPRELVARVRAMLRRPRGGTSQTEEAPARLVYEGLVVDQAGREVSVEGRPVSLTPLEFNLLAALASEPGRVLTRAQLLERVWGYDFYGDDHVVDVHLASLRKKIEPNSAQPRWLQTVRGVGYRFTGQRP